VLALRCTGEVVKQPVYRETLLFPRSRFGWALVMGIRMRLSLDNLERIKSIRVYEPANNQPINTWIDSGEPYIDPSRENIWTEEIRKKS
jgi:hypothetical protein